MELAWDIVELGKFCQKALNELEQFRTQKTRRNIGFFN